MTKKISDEVKDRLRDLGLPRYKFLVQVVLGQKVGEVREGAEQRRT